MHEKQSKDTTARRHIHVDGVVQGVGFRPFVYNLATGLGLAGWVRNTSAGVDIEAQGIPAALDAFVRDLCAKAPPLAVIERIDVREAAPLPADGRFEIRHSASAGGISLIAPDVATCPDCRRELFDPDDRRYRYPFTNCTNCGPRFTIIKGLPYDRPQTTMDPFKMCAACQAEYDDPTDRRFHAQPNACPACGPLLGLFAAHAPCAERHEVGVWLAGEDDALRKTAELLRNGAIVAIKGLGGFHLACDATWVMAVQRMRERKGRAAKPFAVMVRDLAMAREHCYVSDAEAGLLASPAAPIVLLRRRPESRIAPEVAPGNHDLGVMLPYTPLHHILLHDAGVPLVMTSGNHTDEPLSYRNDRVIDELGDIADAYLLHDRAVHIRADDSVMMVVDGAPYPVRRSRGYAPYPVTLASSSLQTSTEADTSPPTRQAAALSTEWRGGEAHDSTAPVPPLHVMERGIGGEVSKRDQGDILAVGGQMKNTLCFLKGERAFLSQHIGELDNLETLEYFEQAAAHLKAIFRAEPAVIAHDLHPDYLSTRWAKGELSAALGVGDLLPGDGAVRRIGVQHHHAHIAACLADNDYPEGAPVIGLAWDGTGYGPDGAVWGGEFLIADRARYERLAHLAYAPLPGGEAAIRRPARLAAAYLLHFLGEVPDLPGLASVGETERRLIKQQIERNYNMAWTSSMGRLFDVAAAMLGLCPDEITFEAQAAIALEMAARAAGASASLAPYPVSTDTSDAPHLISPAPMLRRIAQDVRDGAPVSQVALRFHVTLADHLAFLARLVRRQRGLNTVALSGGVWQNRLLLRLALERLRAADFDVLIHRRVPANDGGLSLGQAVVARAALAK
ncbi:MAG: carbamoyltransferase HypF [Anaerolineae bacterium]|nr:carbamoyltransferase HypF [Anaerolineae bacterium]